MGDNEMLYSFMRYDRFAIMVHGILGGESWMIIDR